jgi:heptosyltransferase-2
MKIGILLPNWVGDTVMATPTLRAIHKRFRSEAEIACIMRPPMAEILAGADWFDHAFYCDRRSDQPELGTRELLRRLRAWKPDSLVLLTNSFWAGALAWLSGARQRIGYARNGRGPLLTKALLAPRSGRTRIPIPATEYYLKLAYALGCPAEPPQTELATLPRDEAVADRVWHKLGLNQARRVVVFNTGSAVGSAKSWPTEHYVSLARLTVADPQVAVLVICGPAEREAARAIEQAANHPRVKSLPGQDIGLGVSKACVRRSGVMVTTDSGPRHFALAFGVPVITLFGPTDPRWIDSRNPLATNMVHPVDCGPCGKSVCPLAHHRCMRDLSVDRVSDSLQRLLSLDRRQSA